MMAPVCLFLTSSAADLSRHLRFYKQAAIKSSFGSLLTEAGWGAHANTLVADVRGQSLWGSEGTGSDPRLRAAVPLGCRLLPGPLASWESSRQLMGEP